jgi:hypothetical protein
MFALWMGGFVFYASFVVPIVREVDGATGHITEHVTVRFNAVGLAALVVWSALLACEPKRAPRRKLAAALIAAIFGLLAWLHFLHPMVAAADAAGDRAVFYLRHRIYLWVSTVQFVVCLMLLYATLTRWRAIDSLES